MTEYRFSPEVMLEFEQNVKRSIIVEMNAWGYLCPKCHSPIHYNRREKLYFCEPCGFVQTKAQYRGTLAGIRHSLSQAGVTGEKPPEESELSERAAKRRAMHADSQMVYYVRFRDVVKIGTTWDLGGRMAALPWEEILALEPGRWQVEKRRHRQFVASRFVDEWFFQSDELDEHIRKTNDLNSNWRRSLYPDLPELPWLRQDVSLPARSNVLRIDEATRVI